MAHAAAKTGSGPTVIVAVEQHIPLNQRIIADDLAPRILPFGARVFGAALPLAYETQIKGSGTNG
jgi:hypothetical protein